MPERSCDDVIRIRIDTGCAVDDFLELLRRQAEEGETRAPAKPANRAVFRELAPYLLVEYEYIHPAIGKVEAVYVGFPDGVLYSAAEDIPEAAVDRLVAEPSGSLAAIYVYVVPARAMDVSAGQDYLTTLARHLGRPVVAALKDADGVIRAHAFAGDGPWDERLARQASLCEAEKDRHFSKSTLMERFGAGTSGEGLAYAVFSYDYGRHVAQFPSAAERDDFIAWSRRVVELHRSGYSGALEGLSRPAEPCAAPEGEIQAISLVAPMGWQNGSAWLPLAEPGIRLDHPSVSDYWGMVIGALREAAVSS